MPLRCWLLVLPLLLSATPRVPAESPGCGQLPPRPQGGPTGGMMLVPAGPFWRGCNPAVDKQCQPDEKPGRCVTLSAFEIDRTEVTQEAWAACVADKHCSDDRARTNAECGYQPGARRGLPMSCITWGEADAYCRYRGKRLPTEAEWEKAARGPDGRTYPWGNTPATCEQANTVSCGGRLREVGTTTGDSPYGVKDMAGNVWEWVADVYSVRAYATAADTDPTGPVPRGEGQRIGRGGGFEFLRGQTPARFTRSAFRHAIDPRIARVGIGFRCARPVP